MGAPHTWSLLRMLKLTDTPAVATERPAAAMPDEPRYMSATGEYYHPRPLKGPSSFQRARQPMHPDAPVSLNP